jgi:hypothetical protein
MTDKRSRYRPVYRRLPDGSLSGRIAFTVHMRFGQAMAYMHAIDALEVRSNRQAAISYENAVRRGMIFG